MIDQTGIYELTHDEYHSDPAITPSLSRSTIKDLIFRTPAHAAFNHPRLNPAYQPDDGNGKFDVGLASHSILLEGIDNVEVIDAEDWRTKAAKEARDEARKIGKTPLLNHQFEEVKKSVVRVEEQIYGCKELGIKSLMADGDHEQSFIWEEEENVWCRCRPDWLSRDHKLILDVKFTDRDANPMSIDKHIVSMGYQIQDSFYSRGVKSIYGVDNKFIFIFAEVNEPYLCSFVGLSPQFKNMGQQQIEFGIFTWKQCLKNNEWPGYPQKVAWVDAPAWALAYWEQIGAEIGEGK